MARLIYSAITSLDGYIEDERGEFGWDGASAAVLLPAVERAKRGSVKLVSDGNYS